MARYFQGYFTTKEDCKEYRIYTEAHHGALTEISQKVFDFEIAFLKLYKDPRNNNPWVYASKSHGCSSTKLLDLSEEEQKQIPKERLRDSLIYTSHNACVNAVLLKWEETRGQLWIHFDAPSEVNEQILSETFGNEVWINAKLGPETLEDLQDEKQSKEQEIQKYESEIETLESELHVAQKELEDLNKAKDSLESKIADREDVLQNKPPEIGDSKLLLKQFPELKQYFE
jgi:hypothetical protein